MADHGKPGKHLERNQKARQEKIAVRQKDWELGEGKIAKMKAAKRQEQRDRAAARKASDPPQPIGSASSSNATGSAEPFVADVEAGPRSPEGPSVGRRHVGDAVWTPCVRSETSETDQRVKTPAPPPPWKVEAGPRPPEGPPPPWKIKTGDPEKKGVPPKAAQSAKAIALLPSPPQASPEARPKITPSPPQASPEARQKKRPAPPTRDLPHKRSRPNRDNMFEHLEEVLLVSHDNSCCYDRNDEQVHLECIHQFKDPPTTHDGRNADVNSRLFRHHTKAFESLTRRVKKTLVSSKEKSMVMSFYCRRGKHRSVSCVELFGMMLRGLGLKVHVYHKSLVRHLDRACRCAVCTAPPLHASPSLAKFFRDA